MSLPTTGTAETGKPAEYRVVNGDDHPQLFETQAEIDEHWQGMPEFVQEKQRPYAQLIVRFRNQADLEDFARLLGQTLNRNSQCTWHPELKAGDIQRVYVDES